MAEPGTESSPTAPTASTAPPLIDGLEPGMTIVRRVKRPPRWPGILSGVLALLMLAVTATGIQLAAHGQLQYSTDAAYAAIALSAAAVIVGIVAIAKRWGRGAGIAGLIVAVLGNPLVLLYGLSWFGGS